MSQTLELSVPQIKCGGCAETVEEALASLTGVEKVAVGVEAKSVHIDFDQTQVSETVIRQTLQIAGFPAQ